MHSDTVGESTQGHTYLPSATQGASSDDCSAVNLETTTAAQDDNISTLAQHAQQGLPLPADAQHHEAADGAHTVSNSHKSLRKRKKPEQSIPPPNQMQIEPSTSNQAANGTQSEIADAEADKGSLPVNLAPVVSCRKGKWKGSKLSEGQSSLEASQGSAHSLPSSTGTAAAGRKVKAKNKYSEVIGRTIDIPAPIFGVDVPDLYYRGTVLKKDTAHPGSVVVRFIEDGSRYWFPVTEVERFLKDMQSKGRDAASDTIGQGSHAFAAQVLAATLAAKKKASGMTSSSATAGSQGVEVSSGVHSSRARARSPSRFSRERPPSSHADEQTSSLHALAAVADSGDV